MVYKNTFFKYVTYSERKNSFNRLILSQLILTPTVKNDIRDINELFMSLKIKTNLSSDSFDTNLIVQVFSSSSDITTRPITAFCSCCKEV